MKKTAALLAALLVGCGTPPQKQSIRIESDPPGARIFFSAGVNEQVAERKREYAGTTPCDFTPWSQDADQRFDMEGTIGYSSFVQTAFIFWAEPPNGATNLYPKKQVFHGSTITAEADRVPAKLFYDLTKP